jgi:hypothetical protein
MNNKGVFTGNAIENITFKQWISTDRCELVTIVKSTEEFIESLLEKLLLLLLHSFTATQQAMFLKKLKSNLQSGEFVVLCNIAENYSFILQDEAQGFHWNNAQATIHTFVIYFMKSDTLNSEHENLVMISHCLKHDCILVHTFEHHLMKFIENTFESPLKKMVYFSDGSAAQYKNRKNLLNITFHNEDFALPAEWHFFVTSHGKSACDGVGGTLKKASGQSQFAATT